MMETHLGKEEEEEEEATFNRSRRNTGFQGFARKIHPDWLQRSWSSHLEAQRWGWGTPLGYNARTLCSRETSSTSPVRESLAQS